VRTLATTVDRWWNEIAAFIDTGHSNVKSEGINRVITLVARAAFGFRLAGPADTSAPLNFEDPPNRDDERPWVMRFSGTRDSTGSKELRSKPWPTASW
jgi:hypothetical protein